MVNIYTHLTWCYVCYLSILKLIHAFNVLELVFESFFLQLGIEGGFDVSGKKYEFEEHNSVVLLPDFNVIPLPCVDLPDTVSIFLVYIIDFYIEY